MPEPSVLLIENDAAMADIVASALRSRGHEVTVSATGRAGLQDASDLEPNLVILDLGLPDIDGIDVCRALRRWYRRPIIVLSADGEDVRKVAALDSGADDYVTKPFSMPELLARLRVASRHAELISDERTLSIGALTIDAASHLATLAEEPLKLTPREFELLHLLARHAGRVVTHGAILERVWGTSDARRTDTLRVHVNQVRKKLAGTGDGTPQILTEPGIGYRLVQ